MLGEHSKSAAVTVAITVPAGAAVLGDDAPAAASSAVETSGTFPSHTVLWAPLESAEEVEVYELYQRKATLSGMAFLVSCEVVTLWEWVS